MAVQYNPRIVTDGLVLCLDGANRKSYPGSGTNWSSTVNDINFTLINGPVFTSDNFGSIIFDGANDFARTFDSRLRIGTNDFTVEIWFFWQFAQDGNYKKILGTGSYLQPGFVIIGNDTATVPTFAIQYGTSTWISVGTGVPNVNAWNHGVATRLNGVINVYLNNVNVGSRTDSYNMNNSNDAYVIGSNAGPGEWFKGRISVVNHYNKGFSQQEVTQNFNALRGRFGI
jgi:hypothetical protein